ncbi:MAG: low temperature requirement protein A [Clostridiaceae bacterium]
MSKKFDYENSEEKYEVTPIELFFDIIYAFVISQLTQYLLTDLTWQGVIKTLVMLVAIYMVWAYTSWAATMIRADQSVSHWMILTVMFIGFFMNISVTGAFSNSGWLFIATFLIIQFGRTLWTILYSPDAISRDHFWRVLIWLVVSAAFWIAGLCATSKIRILLWFIAAGIDLLGTWLAHPLPNRRFLTEDVEFDAVHFLERCRLFRLIAIGEMVFTLGAAIRAASLNLMSIVLGVVIMAEIVSLWGLTFGRFYRLVRDHVENTKNTIRPSRYAINALVIILYGLIAVSVANQQIVLHPFDVPSPVLSFLLGGGPILFLVAQGWYLIKVPNVSPRLYVACGVLLFIVSIGACFFPAWISLVIVGLIITLLALLDSK